MSPALTKIDARIAANRAYRLAQNERIERGRREGQLKQLMRAAALNVRSDSKLRATPRIDFVRWPRTLPEARILSNIPDEMRQAILDEDHLCCWCHTRASSTVDHVRPLARGGTNHPLNLVGACAQCNEAKQDFLPVELGWILHLPQRAFRLAAQYPDHIHTKEGTPL